MIPVWLAATMAGCIATGLAVLWIAGHWGFIFDVVGIGALIAGGLALLGLVGWPFGAYRYDVGRLVGPPPGARPRPRGCAAQSPCQAGATGLRRAPAIAR